MPAAKPPDIVFLAAQWQPRALIRAQLIEEGFEVVATASWAVMRRHLRPGSKPRLAIVDLKDLPDPQSLLHDLQILMKPDRVLVLISSHPAALRHRRPRQRCSAGDVVTFDVFHFAQALSSPNAIVKGEQSRRKSPCVKRCIHSPARRKLPLGIF